MRAIRYLLIAILAVVLILVATANRGPISLNLMPDALAEFAGGQISITLPAFLALFLAMAFGLVAGLVWEWLREAGQRAESNNRARELARLEREVGGLRQTHAAPGDDVLAILDESAARKTPARPGLPSR
ncbi:MAG: LapA family protein [Paracoccus sp. (in: a-proteobacteria)]|uniref:LapA family protein n=1 Tax=Paracoccus sp. TaxID=267 RepID=UPI0039E2DDC8